MGTTYAVTSNCPVMFLASLQSEIDSLLVSINDDVSTYIPTSFISKINAAEKEVVIDNYPKHFEANLIKAQEYFALSDGYLDVSILPLVNYWGFGYTPKVAVTQVDSVKVAQLKSIVGLDNWNIQPTYLIKSQKSQQLDFSALAKGYAVDEVGRLLNSKGCTDFLVDIGGEQIAKGLSGRGDVWRTGINTPDPAALAKDIELILELKDKAIATSGNYRIFYEVEGRKYGHTLNPKSGYPYQDELLSVSIIADQCIDADAIATACMAMGYEKAATFIATMPNISACFLIGASDGTIQPKYFNGFIRYIFQPEI